MARPIEQIEQERAQLAEAATDLAARLKAAYSNYFETLGTALQQQLALAAFRLCTQGYPEALLALSVQDRRDFQQKLRQLGQDASAALNEPDAPEAAIAVDGPDAPVAIAASTDEPEDSDPPPAEIPIAELTDAIAAAISEQAASDPDALFFWCKGREGAIARTLKQVSSDANLLLQKYGILSPKLPAQVLEAAVEAEEAGGGGLPNTLNVVLQVDRKRPEEADETAETPSDEGGEQPRLAKLAALRLRLTDLELADKALSKQREHLRKLLAELEKLRKVAHRLNRDWNVSKAEAAWRSTWSDD